MSRRLLVLIFFIWWNGINGQTYRINCGGSAYTDSRGFSWSADNFFFGGSTSSTQSSEVFGTVDDPIYLRYRWKSGSLVSVFLKPFFLIDSKAI